MPRPDAPRRRGSAATAPPGSAPTPAGHLASNILTFILCFALLCGSLVLFSYWISDPKAGPVFALAIAAYVVTFLIPCGCSAAAPASTP
ncbi:Uncharacterised protein [Rothia kristinae]|nr:Uncharacterised protein [Rothia kristinae]